MKDDTVATKLEHRLKLYKLIKECDKFFYGLQTELKRIQTMNDDTVATKLGHDIHTLMAVLEGG